MRWLAGILMLAAPLGAMPISVGTAAPPTASSGWADTALLFDQTQSFGQYGFTPLPTNGAVTPDGDIYLPGWGIRPPDGVPYQNGTLFRVEGGGLTALSNGSGPPTSISGPLSTGNYVLGDLAALSDGRLVGAGSSALKNRLAIIDPRNDSVQVFGLTGTSADFDARNLFTDASDNVWIQHDGQRVWSQFDLTGTHMRTVNPPAGATAIGAVDDGLITLNSVRQLWHMTFDGSMRLIVDLESIYPGLYPVSTNSMPGIVTRDNQVVIPKSIIRSDDGLEKDVVVLAIDITSGDASLLAGPTRATRLDYELEQVTPRDWQDRLNGDPRQISMTSFPLILDGALGDGRIVVGEQWPRVRGNEPLFETLRFLGGGMIVPSGQLCFDIEGAPGDAAIVNLTPVRASGVGNGQLISSSVKANPPIASNVNFSASSVDPNVATAIIGDDGQVCFQNSNLSAVHLIADHLGTINGAGYTPATASGAPARLVDTRNG